MAVLDALQTLVTYLIILSILVVAHEWGHFIVARIFGIRVDDFSIGFGKRLFRIAKRGDTEYNVRLLPLGGFVKIAGMEADEEPLIRAKDKVLGKKDDPDAKELPLVAENTAETTPYTAPDGFNSKPRWQRSLVILAGPVMSFLLGYAILCFMGVTVGAPTNQITNKVGMVEPGGEGQRIGLHAGDVILAIDGAPMTDGKQMIARINNNLGHPLVLTVQRRGKLLTISGTPRPRLDDDNKPVLFVDVVSPGALGAAVKLQPGDTLEQINGQDVSGAAQVLSALRAAAGKSVEIIVARNYDPVTLKGTLPSNIGSGLPTGNGLPTLNAHPVGVLKFDPEPKMERVSLRESIHQGNQIIVRLFAMIGSSLNRHDIQQSAGGVIRMYQYTHIAVQSGFSQVVFLMAQLSISLAIFNLFPIPILDGGHLLTFFIEWVRGGKKLTMQQQQAMMMTGLAIIATLFVLIFTNDILRTVRHQLPQ